MLWYNAGMALCRIMNLQHRENRPIAQRLYKILFKRLQNVRILTDVSLWFLCTSSIETCDWYWLYVNPDYPIWKPDSRDFRSSTTGLVLGKLIAGTRSCLEACQFSDCKRRHTYISRWEVLREIPVDVYRKAIMNVWLSLLYYTLFVWCNSYMNTND